MDLARLVRAEVDSVKNEIYILSARASGFTNFRIIFHHILPVIITPVMINAVFRIGSLILIESALSFLGIGVRPPTASWGSIINEGKDVLQSAWWISTIPGLLISLTVLSFNLLGDKIRTFLLENRSIN
jgi:peptide/nickel transport system permease protein